MTSHQSNVRAAWVGSVLRLGGGLRVSQRLGPRPQVPLVRERLCELELPYLLHNVAKGSPSRPAFIARSGKMQVPFLRDPNTGAALFESRAIVDYLDQTYGS